MSDVNLYSYNGPDWNGRSFQHLNTVGNLEDAVAGKYSSPLKFSTGLRDFTLDAPLVIGGKDACVDINNLCSGIRIHLGEWRPTGQFAGTIKGGTTKTELSGALLCHGKKADFIYGDWSDQSHDKVTESVLNIIAKTPDPVRVLVLKAHKPAFVTGSGPYEWLFPSPNLPMHDLIVYGFETLRRWGAFREESNK